MTWRFFPEQLLEAPTNGFTVLCDQQQNIEFSLFMFLLNLPSLAGLNSQPGSTLQLSIAVLVWRNNFSANTLISPHLVTGSLPRLIAFWQNAVGHCPTSNSCSEKRLLWRCVSIHLINCSRKLSTEFIFSIICRSNNQTKKISTQRIWPLWCWLLDKCESLVTIKLKGLLVKGVGLTCWVCNQPNFLCDSKHRLWKLHDKMKSNK